MAGTASLAAFRGREPEASTLIEAAIKDAVAGGEGLAVRYAHWTTAVLCNGLGRYQDALAAARQASEDTPELFLSAWALPELIEAATRSGKARPAADAAGSRAAAQACGRPPVTPRPRPGSARTSASPVTVLSSWIPNGPWYHALLTCQPRR